MNAAFEKYAKKTKYDLGKQVKKDNFMFLNENYCEKEQTVLIGDSITEIFNWYELFADFQKPRGRQSTTAASAVTQATGCWRDWTATH